MTDELSEVFRKNPRYREAYDSFFESHKKHRGGTAEDHAAFEKIYAADFLRAVEHDSNEREILIRGDRLTIRRAHIVDADFMRSVEMDADNAPWVANWPLGWRIAKLGDPDFLQAVIEREDGMPIGILILRDMACAEERLQLKRIALIDKGKGYGKEALYLVQKLAFEVFGTKYLYLITKPENLRAQSIYKTTGFTPEMPDPCTQFHLHAVDYFNRSSM